MKDAFSAYPELAALDATYILLKMSVPVHLRFRKDENYYSDILVVQMIKINFNKLLNEINVKSNLTAYDNLIYKNTV